MRTVGIICEYNPFHNGHALHLRQARAQSGADFVVCVMSGCFTQRGEAALLDPWIRAKMALMNDADVVLELPCLWATGPAQRFARGGVSLLHGLGISAISFGVEGDDPEALFRIHRLLREEAAYQKDLAVYLAEGHSFPRARGLALEKATGSPLPNLPNLSLALEYLSAMDDIAPDMRVYPIQRQGEGYHSQALSPLASASAIRAALADEALNAVAQSMPEGAFVLLRETLAQGRHHPTAALDQAALYAVRGANADTLAGLADMGEGLEQRFLWEAQYAATAQELLTRVKSKRYPYARLSRLLLNALLHIPQSLVDAYPAPTYARLLGMRRSAGPLLRHWRNAAALPIITRGADERLRGDALWALDVRAYDVWALGAKTPQYKTGGRIFATPPVIV